MIITIYNIEKSYLTVVRSGDQGASPLGRAPKENGTATPGQWPFGVSFIERGLRVVSSPVLLSFCKNSFVSIVRCLPHTGFLLSFIHNMVETKERQDIRIIFILFILM